MAEVTITASAVLPSSTTASTTNTYERGFNAGVALAQGQVVYRDSSDLWQLTDSNLSATAAGSQGKVGFVVNAAQANCPITVQTGGDINPGGTLTQGLVYVAGATTPGAIAPSADLAAGWYRTVLGVATSASNLRMPPGGPWVSGITA